MSLEALQLAAGQWPIKALVLTARLSNPLGVSMPDHRQKQLLNLAARFDIQIVEDDIYGELMFEQDQYKALKSNDRDGRVIYCSSFPRPCHPVCVSAGSSPDAINRRSSACRPSVPTRPAA